MNKHNKDMCWKEIELHLQIFVTTRKCVYCDMVFYVNVITFLVTLLKKVVYKCSHPN